MYIWQQPGWPKLRWRDAELLSPLGTARLKQGQLLGSMASIGFELKRNAQLEALTEDVLRSSEIEGEILDRTSVRSSIARRLGVPDGGMSPSDRRTEGVVDMVLDATTHFDAPLTRGVLCGWQAALFPTGYSGMRKIKVGDWRDDADGPMQVVSGATGRERVHYEAPPAERVESEMTRFLAWFNGPGQLDGVLRAGIAHFWYVTVHPFEDGNGRIARAIADKALAQAEQSAQRFYSMSSQIRRERDAYYDVLERTQKGSLDVTEWLLWFIACFTRALDAADHISSGVLRKAELLGCHQSLSDRQRTVLSRLLDGFEGKLTAKKWATLGKCSVQSAQRDINDLLERGLLRRNPGGSKNTSYQLVG